MSSRTNRSKIVTSPGAQFLANRGVTLWPFFNARTRHIIDVGQSAGSPLVYTSASFDPKEGSEFMLTCHWPDRHLLTQLVRQQPYGHWYLDIYDTSRHASQRADLVEECQLIVRDEYGRSDDVPWDYQAWNGPDWDNAEIYYLGCPIVQPPGLIARLPI